MASIAKSKKEAKRRLQEEKKKQQQEKKNAQSGSKSAPKAQKASKKPSGSGKASGPSDGDDRPIGKTIGAPTNFSHDTHVGWDSASGFEIRNIPPQWKQLFQAAGVKRSDMEDPATRKIIMNAVKTTMMQDGNLHMDENGDILAPSMIPPPPSNAPPPPVNVPPPPSNAPPPPNLGLPTTAAPRMAPRGPTTLAIGTKCTAKWSGDGAFYPALVNSVRDEGDQKIYNVTFTEYGNAEDVLAADVKADGPAPAAPQAGGGGGGGGLDLTAALSAGRNGLKNVQDSSPVVEKQELNIKSSIEKALQARRIGMVSVYGQDDIRDKSEWDDDDDDNWMDF